MVPNLGWSLYIKNSSIVRRYKLGALWRVTLQKYSLTLWWIKSCNTHIGCRLYFPSFILQSFRMNVSWCGLGPSGLLFIMHGRCIQGSRFHHVLAATKMDSNVIFFAFFRTWKSFFHIQFLLLLVAIATLIMHCSTNSAINPSVSHFVLLCCFMTLAIYFTLLACPLVFVANVLSFSISWHTFFD